jgi:hypothetical protein
MIDERDLRIGPRHQGTVKCKIAIKETSSRVGRTSRPHRDPERGDRRKVTANILAAQGRAQERLPRGGRHQGPRILIADGASFKGNFDMAWREVATATRGMRTGPADRRTRPSPAKGSRLSRRATVIGESILVNGKLEGAADLNVRAPSLRLHQADQALIVESSGVVRTTPGAQRRRQRRCGGQHHRHQRRCSAKESPDVATSPPPGHHREGAAFRGHVDNGPRRRRIKPGDRRSARRWRR